MSTIPLLRWMAAGLASTLSMDIGSALVRKSGFTAGLPPRLIGRWFALMRSQPDHRTIADSPAVRGELVIAVVSHYLIGISLAVVFGVLVGSAGVSPTPASGFALALTFGVCTNALPWFWMFPSMGFGVLGRAGPPELLLLRSSFVNHVIFGLGLASSSYWLGLLRIL
jgi:hypothetical protein